MNAEIIAIGDEITSGQLLDTNTQWLSLRLEALGVRTLYHSTVGDELDPNVDVFRHAIERADVIVATGGLGPTADDLTRDALAKTTGCPLQCNDEALEYIRNLFARRKRPMPPQNELQALFPAGSRVIPNPHGTAPGIDMEIVREGRTPCRLFALPGVPAEMVEMWNGYVAEAVRSLPGRGRIIRRRKLHCFGAGESQVESMLPDLIRRGRQPTVGITASKATITLRIAAEGDTEAECEKIMAPTIETIRQCLGSLIFGEDDDELQDVVVRQLAEHGKTLSTVEWGTAGLITDLLGHVDKAAAVYSGGLTVANEAACCHALELPTGTSSDAKGNLSEGGLEIAKDGLDDFVRAMAIRCRERFGADFGLAMGPILGSAAGDPAASTSCAMAAASCAMAVANAGKETCKGSSKASADDAAVEICIALADADRTWVQRANIGFHPAIREIYCAKLAFVFLRCRLMELHKK
jgi:nicotinamide-nucleotide amidase